MRLDKYLAGKFNSRTKAAQAIEEGLVLINGKPVAPSYDFKDGDDITFIQPDELFVSNGGYKLSKALKDFGFSVKDKTFADIGASNGGFTDCLLQNGAKKVYCIDVGESQLDESLKGKNVVILDNFNARNLSNDTFPERIDGVVADVSFISLTYILMNIAEILDDGGYAIALIKPQFECEGKNIGKGGIVKDTQVHKKVITKIYNFARECGLFAENLTNAPIRKDKNKEYLILLRKNGEKKADINLLLKYVKL
ncbi:MAG: TlyA family RNA methyltransferase [Clostridiales bacterium]|nr:TlyA family RNA methyltransferase [Clostridiales bacterium]